MTAQPLFDGTFSSDAVASAAHALVARLHDEAMTAIAELADGWGKPVADVAVAEDEPVGWSEPATWSVEDDEDEAYGLGAEDDDVRVVPLLELPALLPRPRPAAANVAALLAGATTDEFAVTGEDRESVAV